MKNLKRNTIVSAVIILILGTVSHFIYQLTGSNTVAGFFFPVNESTWEHLKLILTPMFLVGLVQWFLYGREYKNFFSALFFGVIAGMLSITVLFYTYTGIVGKNFMAADIMTFVAGTAAACYVQYRILKSGKFSSDFWVFIGISGFILLFVFSALASLEPPEINLFKDPLAVKAAG